MQDRCSPEEIAAAHSAVTAACHALIATEAALTEHPARRARALIERHLNQGLGLGKRLQGPEGDGNVTPIHLGKRDVPSCSPALLPAQRRACHCRFLAAAQHGLLDVLAANLAQDNSWCARTGGDRSALDMAAAARQWDAVELICNGM